MLPENLEEPDASVLMTRKRFISSSRRIHVERIERDFTDRRLLFSTVSSIVELTSGVVTFPAPVLSLSLSLPLLLLLLLLLRSVDICRQFVTAFFAGLEAISICRSFT